MKSGNHEKQDHSGRKQSEKNHSINRPIDTFFHNTVFKVVPDSDS